MWKLSLSQGEPIEATAGHPIYSVTRHAFIHVAHLHLGEQLYSRDSHVTLIVTGVASEHRFASTYTFEVEGDHPYYVGTQRVLVHHICANNEAAAKELLKEAANTSPDGHFESRHGADTTDAQRLEHFSDKCLQRK